jgi:LAGLIDADG DNA endonuclease family protein
MSQPPTTFDCVNGLIENSIDVARSIESEIDSSRTAELFAYLHGAARDGTFNRLHGTFRFAQAGPAWLGLLRRAIGLLGRKAWIYREGSRNVWVLETKLEIVEPHDYPSRLERLAFVRGYFDAEGGVPRARHARFYVQFAQKDLEDLSRLRDFIEAEGIACGRLHNPSARVDPEYWRFYVAAVSIPLFANAIGSWHPRKRELLEARVGISVSASR